MNPNKVHRIKYFMEFFSRIPDKLWCTRVYQTCDNPRRHCAAGHLGNRADTPYAEAVLELNALIRSVVDISSQTEKDIAITTINDGTPLYRLKYGGTPKERMLNVLKECLEKETNHESEQNTPAQTLP